MIGLRAWRIVVLYIPALDTRTCVIHFRDSVSSLGLRTASSRNRSPVVDASYVNDFRLEPQECFRKLVSGVPWSSESVFAVLVALLITTRTFLTFVEPCFRRSHGDDGNFGNSTRLCRETNVDKTAEMKFAARIAQFLDKTCQDRILKRRFK